MLEEVGIANWRSAGAVDRTEWVSQIRTATTIFGPYQLQEASHASYWGQLAMRNCLRQAYNGGAVRGGRCVRVANGLNAARGAADGAARRILGAGHGPPSAGRRGQAVIAGGRGPPRQEGGGHGLPPSWRPRARARLDPPHRPWKRLKPENPAKELVHAAGGRMPDEPGGSVRAALANAMVGMKKQYYGRGPTAAKAWMLDDYVFVALEGGLTRSEETLLADGKEDEVRRYRLSFQETMGRRSCRR